MKPEPLPPEWFAQNKVDGVLTRTSETIADPLLTKFTGIAETSFAFHFLQEAQKNILLCGTLESGTVKQHYQGKIRTYRTRKEIIALLRGFMGKKRIGINESYLTAQQAKTLRKNFPRARFTDVSEALYETRRIKTKEELGKIREAVKVTEGIMKKIPGMMDSRTTEIALGAEIEYHFAKEGCPPAFPTIVAFGKNSTNIHHFNTHTKIGKGENVLVDCGAKFQGYCADLSRTFTYGHAPETVHTMYEKVRKAQDAAFATIRPGNHAYHSMETAEKELGHILPHALGHGIGLETHDTGVIHTRERKFTYLPGMAIAIEPGYYGKKWGIRLEDD
ncbi:MAG: Xaa-Pro peptidase family protein, partial [archaeon]